MSCLANTQFEYLNNKNKKLYYNEDDRNNEDFNFQFVPVNQFNQIIKDVRRQKMQDKEKLWTPFFKEQEQSITDCQQCCDDIQYSSSRTLAESFEEVDRELMRLKGDTVPETCIEISNSDIKNQQEKNLSLKIAKQEIPTTRDCGTGSTNCLLTIPEEINAYCQMMSSTSCKPSKMYIKKTCSDQTLKTKRIHTKYHYSTNDLDCKSNPDISSNQLSNANYSIVEHPDPIVITKILNMQRKICIILDSISTELDRIPLPDGENDYYRRKQRTVEFSTRLSRNYLYDLSRQISDIERHIKAINPVNKMRLSRGGMILHMQAIEQKLISTHQLLLAALNAYMKHIPNAVLKTHPGKLKEILQIVLQLKNICIEIKIIPDFYCSGDDRDAFLGKETENRCSIILSKFRLNSDNESQVPSHTTRSTVTPSSKKQRNRKILSNRLSMYTMDLRLAKNYQSKKSYNRFQNPKDKKNTCSLSKNLQKSTLPVSKKLQLNSRTNSLNEAIRNKTNKISIPMKEDDIPTMMDTFPSDLDVDSYQSIKSDKRSEICKYKKIETYENTKEAGRLKKNKSCGDEKMLKINCTEGKYFSNFLPAKEDLIIQNYSEPLPLSATRTLHNLNKKCQPKVNLNELQGYVEHETGSSNMQLICCTEKEDKENSDEIIDIAEDKKIFQFNDACCQANYLNTNGMFKLLISDTLMLRLSEYRNQYKSLLKSSPMYTSNTQNKPWDVVAWIADKLVDELIIELSNDFQMEEIIQKLFELEFQEF
ncbi:PREDICTED: uncharacterized protein LOC105364899 [Ceratosolen solmsi marchali]|uniref:Uncharacterized protein LOC105364899 n=1 Tax=Ceratosolen solmsi marchali TaxID=326594 RepID=A0AAJ6YNB8_9HYME|nr:PREDICTED: uncharacterized protein LOC105364899 [Ceratosolen solmsi marchali]